MSSVTVPVEFANVISSSNSAGLGGEPPKPSLPGGFGDGRGIDVKRDDGREIDVTREPGTLELDLIKYCSCGGYKGFSARTSLELLRSEQLTDNQLDFELNYLNLLDPSTKLRTRFPSVEAKKGQLEGVLSKGLCGEVDSIVTNYDDLFATLSYSLKTAQEHIDELKGHIVEFEGPEVPTGFVPITTPESHEPGKLKCFKH